MPKSISFFHIQKINCFIYRPYSITYIKKIFSCMVCNIYIYVL